VMWYYSAVMRELLDESLDKTARGLLTKWVHVSSGLALITAYVRNVQRNDTVY
jgi:hypothetical protein